MNIKALIRPGETHRKPGSGVKYCVKDTKKGVCGERTREGKEFCSDHLENLPYVKCLLKRIQDKNDEVTKVRKKGKKAVKAGSETLREIKNHLEFRGPRTTKCLQREMQLTESTIEGFVDYLEDEGVIRRTKTSRGDVVINPRLRSREM